MTEESCASAPIIANKISEKTIEIMMLEIAIQDVISDWFKTILPIESNVVKKL